MLKLKAFWHVPVYWQGWPAIFVLPEGSDMNIIGARKEDLDTPALWVDLDQLEQNIRYMAGLFKERGVHWRPHTKGIKVPEIGHMLLKAGAIGLTCAKLGEAEVMVAAGISDILIANQVVGATKITRLVNLRRRADVKVAVDNPDNIAEMGKAAQEKGVNVGVLVEIELGSNRAGVAPGEPAVELSKRVHKTPGLQYKGVMGWEGHTREIEDLDERRAAIELAIGKLASSAEACRQAGLPVEIVSAGGTGTHYVTAYQSAITEIQAGGTIFCDVKGRDWGEKTGAALFVRSTITSRPTPKRLIFDAGFKALPAWYGVPEPLGLDGFESFVTSAEHGEATLSLPNKTVKVGDAFDFRVGYSDMTVFLYNELYGIRDGIVEVVWQIQGRGKLS
jgi:D-serine deaminase-like pyridoxal phosphate-dependent protein